MTDLVVWSATLETSTSNGWGKSRMTMEVRSVSYDRPRAKWSGWCGTRLRGANTAKSLMHVSNSSFQTMTSNSVSCLIVSNKQREMFVHQFSKLDRQIWWRYGRLEGFSARDLAKNNLLEQLSEFLFHFFGQKVRPRDEYLTGFDGVGYLWMIDPKRLPSKHLV